MTLILNSVSNKSHLGFFVQSRIVSPSFCHECIMGVFTTVVCSFGRYRNFRGTRIGLFPPTSDWTQTHGLSSVRKEQAITIYFHSSSNVPEPVGESSGSMGIWRISRSAALSCVCSSLISVSQAVRRRAEGLTGPATVNRSVCLPWTVAMTTRPPVWARLSNV